MASKRTEKQLHLWLEYLLAKADGDEITAAYKLKELQAMTRDLIEELAEIIPWCQGTNELHTRAIAEIERLRALKTPASRELLNITKGCLDSAEAEVERLQTANAELAIWKLAEIERLTAGICNAIEALERNSTSAPVLEALRALVTKP